MQTDTFWLSNVQKKDVILENISYNCFKYTVVKWGHTEGIEREKTSSQKSHALPSIFEFFLVFQIGGQNTIGGQYLQNINDPIFWFQYL